MTNEATTDTPTGPFHYTYSAGFPDLLARLRASLFVTTYQAGKLAVFRVVDGRLSLLLRSFEHAMGLAVNPDRMAIGSKFQIWHLENDDRVTNQFDVTRSYDACFLPRRSHITGDVAIHEMAWGQRNSHDLMSFADDHDAVDELWFVNTRFSCLCTVDARYSFVPRWRPSFVDKLAAEDSCHLNGLAMRDGRPRYVTLFAATHNPQGWRNAKDNGCVFDVSNGETIVDGLSMPHSPRWHRESLWVLNSGHGQLASVNAGNLTTVATLPGYTRGLAMREQYAFVGLSKAREQSTFAGVPITKHPHELRCGIWIVDLLSGREIEFIEFQQGVDEVFDVQLLADRLNPNVIGLHKETVRQAYSLPHTMKWDLVPVRDSDPSALSTEDAPQIETRVTNSADHVATNSIPGKLSRVERLGLVRVRRKANNAVEVWYLSYFSRVDGGCHQAAKLYIPRGIPPANGWPISIWLHGLGDPATQLFTWPHAPGRWQRTRGELAGTWAQHGFATLTPWMPGDGPSEPYGTYSPLSLSRNIGAIDDAVRMLQLLTRDDFGSPELLDDRFRPRLNHDRIVLRSDCVASPLLVEYAAHLRHRVGGAGIRAFVADDFLPGIVHFESVLGPRVDQIASVSAAAIRCVWLRSLGSLFLHAGKPLIDLLNPEAVELFSHAVVTPAGTLPAIMATPLVPTTNSQLAPVVVRHVHDRIGHLPTAIDIHRSIYGDELLNWSELRSEQAMLHDSFYREHFAASDPFFGENCEPFSHDVPLFVVGRAGQHAAETGMPNRGEQCELLTVPKVRTLREWGWCVHFLKPSVDAGTSFSGGPAQKWVLEQLHRCL